MVPLIIELPTDKASNRNGPRRQPRMNLNLTMQPSNSNNYPRKKGGIRGFFPTAADTARTVDAA
jgi:hypothetical protein